MRQGKCYYFCLFQDRLKTFLVRLAFDLHWQHSPNLAQLGHSISMMSPITLFHAALNFWGTTSLSEAVLHFNIFLTFAGSCLSPSHMGTESAGYTFEKQTSKEKFYASINRVSHCFWMLMSEQLQKSRVTFEKAKPNGKRNCSFYYVYVVLISWAQNRKTMSCVETIWKHTHTSPVLKAMFEKGYLKCC